MRILGFPRLAVLFLAAGVVSVAGAQSTTMGKVTLKGTSNLGGGSHTTFNTAFIAPGLPEHDLVDARASSIRGAQALDPHSTPAALAIPKPSPDSVSFKGANVPVAFPGLTTVDTALTNGFVLSPPDQGLCVGGGHVVEIINLVLAVYTSTGMKIDNTEQSANAFFGADPATTFLSDPRCYYDAPTQRWFFSMTNVVDSTTGRSNLFLAVSKTNDPAGDYIIYSIDTTDDGQNGTPQNPGCTTASPCFGDQPLLGADAYGIYLTTNEFGVFSDVFNGAQIYALSKSALEAGTATSFVDIGGQIPLEEGIAYSVQPASSPDLSTESAPGVEYFLSALDFFSSLDNRVAVWALTNTQSLNSNSPNVSLLGTVINSEVYGQPPVATQKVGPYPLGQSLGEPEEALNTNDDRMNNVVYASNHLWGGLNTIIGDGTTSGIAYFFVMPSVKGDKLSAKLQGQGYISVEGNSVLFPGIGVTADGTAAAAFTVSGPSYFPSAAYAHITPAHATGVNIVALGQAAQDDFSGYPEFGGDPGVARWGDYSWGVADGKSLWLATEFIPGNINSLDFFTNFGTEVFEVKLQ
jgi:hypothetical protein